MTAVRLTLEPTISATPSRSYNDTAGAKLALTKQSAWRRTVEYDYYLTALLGAPRPTAIDQRVVGNVRPHRASDIARIDQNSE